ncbi:MAG TPA: hypothetical protein VD907_06165 [Verrucomicrobiae bacterium]|nr:hypothetical protein [Verrucomicrobiae bacterium]
MTFISKGFEFTEDDLIAVQYAVWFPGVLKHKPPQRDLQNRPSGSYHVAWSRSDGLRRTNRLFVSCTQGQQPGPTVRVYRVLAQRYPDAHFTMRDYHLRQELNKQGLNIVTP